MSEQRNDTLTFTARPAARRFGKRTAMPVTELTVRARASSARSSNARVRIGGIVLAVFAVWIGHDRLIGVASQAAGCQIKGTIDPANGDRLFRLPSDEGYDVSTVSLMKGEKWFCSEAEARAAGWRKAAD